MLKNYFKIFLKVARQNKLFTFLSLFGISLTIMFVMIFSMTFNKIIKGSGPEEELETMLFVSGIKGVSSEEGQHSSFSSGLNRRLCEDYLKKVSSSPTTSMFAGGIWEFILNGKHHKKANMQTDAEFWKAFDFTFLQGRPYTHEEVMNQDQCVVISESIKDLFFSDEENVLGKTIRFFFLQLTVIGVVEDPAPSSQNLSTGIYLPYTLMPSPYDDPYMGSFEMAFRADKKSQFGAIRKEIQETIDRIDSADDKWKLSFFGPQTQFEKIIIGNTNPEENTKPWSKIMQYLLWGLGFIFLPAINLMALNFARIRERGEEIAVRKSFGANSGILREQFVFENLLLTLTGGVIGIIMSFIVVSLLGTSLSIPVSSWNNVPLSFSFDVRVFTIALLSCLLFGLFSGVLPAIRMSKMKPVKYLKGGEI